MQALARPELINQLRARRVLERWEQIVGDPLFRKSSPARFEHGTLWITVSGASWAQELRMHKGELLEKLNAYDRVFRDLRFVVGKVEQPRKISKEQSNVGLEPEEVSVEFHVPELEAVARRALGRMKRASKRGDVEAD